MDRTQVRRRRGAVMGLGVAVALGFVSGRAVAGPSHPVPAAVYIVHPGDTLWAIAARVAGPTGDPRPIVDGLVTANHLSGSTITPGERLVLPSR